MVEQMTPGQFMKRREAGEDMMLLDVREDWEVKLAPAPTPFVHIPMGQLAARLGELNQKQETVVICRSGGRSMQVAQYLNQQQFGRVSNLDGGILAWSRELDPSIPTY
jgi:rhodanese-related sulfurtransferase